ncbi:MAG: 16S rRNA pseudouridine(516) synthase [Lachnospiraceae bacterium]|nr:16S rRNA pseudouridine(516) synthase [Candidatus Colinaster scatohippi]
MRLDKYLCELGKGTRSEVKDLIKKKKVSVDGSIITDAGYQVNDNSEVMLDGEKLMYEEFRYYMLNKPAGVVSATEDNIDKTVIDLLEGENTRGLFLVGRLDKDTEGLLLITNDGDMSHRLLSPKKHVDKCYYVELVNKIDKESIARLTEGVDIGDDELTLPAKVEAISPTSVYLTITEGRYHQVKRMMLAVDNEVKFLKRVSFGPLELDKNLKPGEYRRLDDDEILMLQIKC